MEKNQGVIEIDGDIILGGLFPLHKKSKTSENECDVPSEMPDYQYMEAMLFSIDKINNDQELLPNITLGAKIHDTCLSKTIAASRAKEFIKMTLTRNTKEQLAGVVGALSSGVSETVANFLRAFEIPQISYLSTSVTLSNKDLYSYFLRTVAPDSFQAQAMVDIIQTFEWTYVATVNSAGTYGTEGMKTFWEKAKAKGICIDSKEQLSSFPKTTEYQKVMERLVKRSRKSHVSVVVLFCTQVNLRGLLEAAYYTQGAEIFTWIFSDGWSNRFDVTVGNAGKAAQGALTIMTRRGEGNDEFKDYFTRLNMKNYPRRNKKYFQDFWESLFKCRYTGKTQSQHQTFNKSCKGNENLANISMEFGPVRVVINAVYAFAHALTRLQKELCPKQVGICPAMLNFQRSRLLEHLKNVAFEDLSLNASVKFDQNGEVSGMYDIMNFRMENGKYRYVRVARWDGELIEGKIKGKIQLENASKWLNGTASVPDSYCSSNCKPGAIRKAMIIDDVTFDINCCWNCMACEKLQSVVNNTCKDGPVGWVSDANRTNWIKRNVLYPKWNDTPATILVLISSICLVLTFITIAVFIVHNEHRIVKASGRELCYVILAGIGLCFIMPFLYIAKPNDPLCYARKLFTGLALAMCYAPLFMKLNRIYRIFISSKLSVARPPLVSPHMQLLVTFSLITIQLMFTALWFIVKPVPATEKYYSDREELVLECKVDKLSFSLNLCYVIVLMILCTVYAFKTRNFPKNFNESKYIGITMYITCAVWMTFFPFYFNISYSFTHIYLIPGACVIIGLVTLTGLFAQKLYIVFYVSEIPTDNLNMTATDKRSTVMNNASLLGDLEMPDALQHV